MKNTELRDEQVWLAVGSLMIVATVALAFALVYMRDVMVPFVLAILITVVVSPVFDFQVVRWRAPRWIAVVTTLLVVLALLALLGYILIVAIHTMVHAAGDYSQQVVALIDRLFAQLNDHHIQIDQARITSELESRLPGIITQTAGTATALISHGFLIVIFVVFLLIGRNPLQRQSGIYAEISTTIRRYITTMTIIATVTSVLVGVVLWGSDCKWPGSLVCSCFY
jgi:predicted PurR-regulated permease PerM